MLYVNGLLKPLFKSASGYVAIELRKMFSSDEMSDFCLAIDLVGVLELLVGGWFIFLMQTGVLSGFLYGS